MKNNKVILLGDINLMGIEPSEKPFARVSSFVGKADAVFANLECCFYDPPKDVGRQIDVRYETGERLQREGLEARTDMAPALAELGVSAVGNANNVNYGHEPIKSSLRELDKLGISHSGAGMNIKQAEEPAIVERNGVRFGLFQRTAVYWPVEHKALLNSAGVATIKAHTSYRPLSDGDHRSANRPGVPPEVITWMDRNSLERIVKQIKKVKKQCDVVIASYHWGLGEKILSYQTELAHASIDAGADIVMGTGPHYPLPLELYKKKPILYGMGSFFFYIGHGSRLQPNELGIIACLGFEKTKIKKLALRLVRRRNGKQTIFRSTKQEKKEIERLHRLCELFGTSFKVKGDELVFDL
ncbi:MAG: CapA family protein [Rhodospirillales bacterium]